MKSATENIAALYEIFNQLEGPLQAKEAVTTMIFLVMTEIQDEGKLPSSFLIERKIQNYVQDFIEVSEKSKSA